MKLGCFAGVDKLEAVVQAGFDSIELDIMELSRMTHHEFIDFAKRCEDTNISFDAFSGFMPLTERIHTAEFDTTKWLNHAKRMGERTHILGAKVWPLGAGKCRSIPDGGDIIAAKRKVADFFGGICESVAEYGITVAIEPLGPANSNFLNTIEEAQEFAAEIQLENCKIMCDLRHMTAVNEPMNEIVKHSQWIVHAHVDYPIGSNRFFPKRIDGFDYQPFINVLVASKCSSVLSIEATSFSDFPSEAVESVKYLLDLLQLAIREKNS